MISIAKLIPLYSTYDAYLSQNMHIDAYLHTYIEQDTLMPTSIDMPSLAHIQVTHYTTLPRVLLEYGG